MFPHLYPHGEMSPLDFQDYKLGRYLLKKQALYAHRMSDGRLQWNFAEDDVHMAHQYSRLSEQTVRATVGYYISSHPSVAHVPLANITTEICSWNFQIMSSLITYCQRVALLLRMIL